MSLTHEPALEPLHISVKQLFLNGACPFSVARICHIQDSHGHILALTHHLNEWRAQPNSNSARRWVRGNHSRLDIYIYIYIYIKVYSLYVSWPARHGLRVLRWWGPSPTLGYCFSFLNSPLLVQGVGVGIYGFGVWG